MLTSIEAKILYIIEEFKKAKDRFPCQKEIGSFLGKTKQAVGYYMPGLEKNGYVEIERINNRLYVAKIKNKQWRKDAPDKKLWNFRIEF